MGGSASDASSDLSSTPSFDNNSAPHSWPPVDAGSQRCPGSLPTTSNLEYEESTWRASRLWTSAGFITHRKVSPTLPAGTLGFRHHTREKAKAAMRWALGVGFIFNMRLRSSLTHKIRFLNCELQGEWQRGRAHNRYTQTAPTISIEQ